MELTVLYNEAVDLIEAGNLSGAAAILTRARKMGGDPPRCLDMLGLCLYARGSFTEAKICWIKSGGPYLKTMEEKKFLKYAASFNACLEAVDRGKPARALGLLLPALDPVPNVAGLNLAGLLFYQLGLRRIALELWKKSLRLDLGDEAAAFYIAGCREGRMPLMMEKLFWGVLSFAGKCKLL